MLRYDLHCHSVKSADAISTIYELTFEAKKKQLDIIAITDHGPGMLDGPDPSYFEISSRIPWCINDIKVLAGCEANILDLDGHIDLPDEISEQQDILLAGLHELTSYSDNSLINNTHAIIKCMENPYIDIICHPYRPNFEVDIKEVANAAMNYNVLLEINKHVYNKYSNNLTYMKSLMTMIEICKDNSYPLSLGSDAHVFSEVGLDDLSKKLDLCNEDYDVFNDCYGYLRINKKISKNSKFKQLNSGGYHESKT